ncbi:glycosyltransferase [Larkinella rosea]|uniref:Glycosyltransferase n=1 Tax=Larkinella rosea TaxID=2025312 RepID=A0A3P1BZ03_9BACT|nr:glycosyltransferase [Larkinella rosea]RRB06340.1 glycosyltransferase [Larkinella rosea]
MNILHICAYSWDIGGPPRIIYDYTSVLAPQGEKLTILTPMSAGDVLYTTAPGVRVVQVKRHWFARFFPEFSPGLYRYLRDHGNEYDIIHIHGIWHFGAVAPYFVKLRAAKVVTIHGLLDRWTLKHGYWKKKIMSWVIQKQLLKKTPLILINNKREDDDVRRYLGYQHPNVQIIPNGLRISEYQNLPAKGTFRQQHQIENNQQMILFLSRIHIKKGVDILLPAFRLLQKTHPNAVLVLAGPDDGYLPDVQQFIETHQLRKSIILPGMLINTDKLAAFADADVFTLPSYSEGFSVAAMEALACGVPAVLTDHVGFSDYLRAYEAAYISDTTVESVRDGLAYLLDHPAEAALMAQNARRMVSEVCDINVVANRVLDAYHQLVPQQV